MFVDSKYTSWYFGLIQSRKIRVLSDNEYYEEHHIIPAKLGGSDTPENKVSLTYREHIIAHYLLTKMCSNSQDRRKMLTAFHAMVYLRNQYNQRDKRILPLRYLERAKKAIIEAKRGSKYSEESRKRIGQSRVYPVGDKHPFYGRSHTKETRSILREKRLKQEPTFLGKKHTDEAKARMSAAKTGVKIKRNIVKCPHCNKEGTQPLMKRWHFDKCKVNR
jgi:hypothetical protein